MKTKEKLSKELGISRKTLYTYMSDLGLDEINTETVAILTEYVKTKKNKNQSIDNLLKQIHEQELLISEQIKQINDLKNGQQALLNQIEWIKNDLNADLSTIKQNMILLLEQPKTPPKKALKDRIRAFFE